MREVLDIGMFALRAYVREYINQQMLETLTLCDTASGSSLDGWSRGTNDGYSENAIAEQFSITGLDIAARYT
jgi:hypothetical protein